MINSKQIVSVIYPTNIYVDKSDYNLSHKSLTCHRRGFKFLYENHFRSVYLAVIIIALSTTISVEVLKNK